ncbi:MAG: anti-sigma factor [Acidobacteriota bacterium]|nr:anti-sigma factor [Acidobacteriota bacterium]
MSELLGPGRQLPSPASNRREVPDAIWKGLIGVLLLGGMVLGLLQHQLSSDVHKTLDDSGTRGALEAKLLDEALTTIHEEKKERTAEVSVLRDQLERVRRETRAVRRKADVYELEFVRLDGQISRMHRDASERRVQLARLDRALSVLHDPDARQVVFGRRAANQPRGQIFASVNRLIILLASNLPPLPAGKTYEFWGIAKGASPLPGGLFQSEPDGSAIHFASLDISPATVAVSIEDAAGAAQPTSTPVLTVEIPAATGE